MYNFWPPYIIVSYIVLVLSSAVTDLSNKTLILHDFQGAIIKFHDIPGLENEILKLHDFPGFPWPVESCERDLESCLQKTASINKIFVPRDQVFLLLSFTVHYNYMEISELTLVLSVRIVLSCFHLLIFYFEKFSNWVSCLPFAVNVTGNLFIMKTTNQNKEFCCPLKMWKIENKKHKNKLKKLPVKMLH